MNVVSYFEIPVSDVERAIAFYAAVFGYDFARGIADGNEMAFFPYQDGHPGASGALARGDSYVPGKSGVRIYFDVPDVQEALDRAVVAGGKMLYPKTAVHAFGYVVELEDLDGNCIGVHSLLA